MTEYFSNKLRWLAVVATLVVVMSHSVCGTWEFALHSKWALPFQVFVTRFMWWPVPFFFMVSGFFLVEQYVRYGWVGLVKKKFLSLYVPVAVWCMLLEFLYLPVSSHLGRVPSAQTWITAPWLLMYETNVGGESLNMADHFWYIRELIVYTLLAPLLYLFSKSKALFPVITFFTALTVLMNGGGEYRIGPYHFMFLWKGLFFVPMGIYLGCLLKNKTRMGLLGSLLMAIVSLTLIIFFESHWGEHITGVPILKLIVQVSFFWFGYDVVDALCSNGIRTCPMLLKGVFFVYCTHYLCIKYVGGILRTVFHQNEVTMMLAYFCNISTFFFCLFVQSCLFRLCPKALTFLTGGRAR